MAGPRAEGARDVLDTPAAGPAAIRGGSLRVIGYAVGVCASVASAALLFRHLGVQDTGRYVTVLSIVTLTGGLTDAGLTNIGIREWAVRRGRERDALLRSLLALRIALSVGAGAVATAFAAVAGYPRAMVLGTALASFALLAQNVQSAFTVPMLAELRLAAATALDLLRQILTAFLIVALVVAGAELLPFFAVAIAAGLIVLVVTAFLLRGRVPLRPDFRSELWLPLLRDTLPYAAATAVAAAYFRVAVVLVSLIASAEETGYFGASYRVIEVLIVVPQLLVGAAFPIFARAAQDDRERFAYATRRMAEAGLVFGGWLAVALALAAPFAIEVVAGDDFEPAASVLRIQALALVASFAAAVWGYALLGLRRHRELLLINLAALAWIGSLTALLTATHGAQGAAAATASGELLLALAGAAVLARTSTGFELPWTTLAKTLVAACAAVALALLLEASPPLEAAGGTLVYFAVLLALRGIPDELLQELRRPLARRRAA